MAKDNREIWVADSETDPFELGVIPEPFIWGLYNGSEIPKHGERRRSDKAV